MSTLIKHKRVEFTELFYDLVFVYAISKTTALIHHLHHGVVTWAAFSAFLVTLLVLVNSWMIQTVFTNRYGKNSLFNILVMFVNMALLLLISSMIISDNWQQYFNTFCWTMGTLSLTLFLQYLVQFFRKESTANDKLAIRGFLAMTGLRTAATYVAALLPFRFGYPLFIIGIIATFLMPIAFRDKQAEAPINFPHLIERVSLLVIITFGEMIMGIANFFTPETFGFHSVLYFLIVATLFMYYFGEFDHAIDEGKDTQGLHLIYSHYPIFIGLLMVTVSLTFLAEHEVNKLFVVLFLYAGLFLFQWAVLSNTVYNKAHVKYSKAYMGLQAALAIIALIASLLAAKNADHVLYITVAYLLAIETHFLIFYTKESQKAGIHAWHWF